MTHQTTVVGNMGAEPKLAYTSAGKPYVSFSIAVPIRKFNSSTNQWDNKGTDWVPCVSFEKDCISITQIPKGTRVLAYGEYRGSETYTRENNHDPRSLHVSEIGPTVRWQTLTVSKGEFGKGGQVGGHAADNGSYANNYGQGQPAAPAQQQPPFAGNGQPANGNAGGFGGGFDDEQPF